MTLAQHMRAAITLVGITLNLCYWCVPLVFLLIGKTCLPRWNKSWNRVCDAIYRNAVRIDDWLLHNVSHARWHSNEITFNHQTYVLVANHVSWSDILLLQSIVAKNGPIIKFLCKWQLTLVPIFGLIILAFDFPILRRQAKRRSHEKDRRESDLDRIRRACRTLGENPAAILSFAEGTRFTDSKHEATGAPYRHLLPPRLGGLETIIRSLSHLEPLLIDVSIAYARPCTLWQFLGGSVPEVQLKCSTTTHATLRYTSVQDWLNDAWREKDDYIARHRTEATHSV